MHPKLANRLLAHSIDAATLTADRSKRAQRVLLWEILIGVGLLIALLIWADQRFV